MTGDAPVLRLEEATRHYRRPGGGAAAAGAFALAPTSLAIRRGSWTVFTGRSGAGKTTVLNLLAGLDRPDSGRVWLFGHDLTAGGEGALCEIRRTRMGIVYQQFRFIDHLPVWQNVTCRLVPEGVGARGRRRRARAVLAELELEDMLDRRPASLSGGEQQRAALARALVAGPEVLIADEPTSNVDADTGEAVVRCLRRRHEGGTTIVVSTHDPMILECADERYELAGGRLV